MVYEIRGLAEDGNSVTLEKVVSSNYQTYLVKALKGADTSNKDIFEWMNGEVLLSSEETSKALLEINTMNYAELVRQIDVLIHSSSDYRDIRRLVPTLGMKKGEFVIYLVLPR